LARQNTYTAQTCTKKSLFQNRKQITIQSDKGTEFVNSAVQQYLKRQGVSFHTTHNPDIMGAIIERFNRTALASANISRLDTRHNKHKH
jgi:transposase InsO family protein